jgi:hypothetical protein
MFVASASRIPGATIFETRRGRRYGRAHADGRHTTGTDALVIRVRTLLAKVHCRYVMREAELTRAEVDVCAGGKEQDEYVSKESRHDPVTATRLGFNRNQSSIMSFLIIHQEPIVSVASYCTQRTIITSKRLSSVCSNIHRRRRRVKVQRQEVGRSRQKRRITERLRLG